MRLALSAWLPPHQSLDQALTGRVKDLLGNCGVTQQQRTLKTEMRQLLTDGTVKENWLRIRSKRAMPMLIALCYRTEL